MPQLSFVIPAFNEEDSLRQLYQEIIAVAKQETYDHEIVFVDDGSTDSTWTVIESLAHAHDNVRGIRFRTNFGKASALRAGAAAAAGELIVTMDADLQDDPAELPKMLEKLGDDFDLVSGWKAVRNDPVNKTLPSKVFNWLVGCLTGVKLHDHNCGFKVYRRAVFDEVKLYGEMHRFVPVLASAKGFRVTEIPVNHRARQHGYSKYGLRRLPKGFLDLLTVSFLTGFNQRPQHLLGMFGLASFSFGALGMIIMAIYWILRMTMYPDWTPLHQRPIVLYSLGALILGTQLLSMGFLAELIVNKDQSREEPYSISETVE